MMPTLLVLNGPPGVGKTTVGEAVARLRAPALRVDVDEVRSLIVGWEDNPAEAGPRARLLAAEMAAVFLRTGGDVILSQLYGRTPDLERLQAVAEAEGAAFVEIVLMGERDEVRRRFIDRGGAKVDDLDQFDTLYDRVTAVVDARPDAVEIPSTSGNPGAVVRAVAAAAGWAPPP